MSEFKWDPAWRDRRLAVACTDVQAGVVGAVREVLAETREARDFARRGYASALLGSLAASGNLPKLWLREEPRSPDALLLAARVAAVHAAGAYRHQPYLLPKLVQQAVDLTVAAGRAWNEDPTPYVVMLGLTKLHRTGAPVEPRAAELGGLLGPWDLVEQGVWARDRFNREAGRQLLAYFSPEYGGGNEPMSRVAAYLADTSPPASPLRLLPMAAFLDRAPDPVADADDDRQHDDRVSAARRLLAEIDGQLASPAVLGGGHRADGTSVADPEDLRARRERLVRIVDEREGERWSEPGVVRRPLARGLVQVYVQWFLTPGVLEPVGAAGYVPLPDMSLLARGLHLAGEFTYARHVLRHLLPFASRYPWSLAGDPEAVLRSVLHDCEVSVTWLA
ncbi:MAG TPA: hypothetical protein VGX23_05220 [Actinocrinis sp.]|nr:hypothetical protein [Actinocrinis sp.]